MKHIAGSALAILTVLSGAESLTRFNLPKQTALSLPSQNLATLKFSSWLSAFNSADRDTILSFYSSSFSGFNETTCSSPHIYSRCQDIYMAKWTGGFKLIDLEDSPNDYSLTVLLQEKNNPIYFRASIVVNEMDPTILLRSLICAPL
jgi:hypothetical protein